MNEFPFSVYFYAFFFSLLSFNGAVRSEISELNEMLMRKYESDVLRCGLGQGHLKML